MLPEDSEEKHNFEIDVLQVPGKKLKIFAVPYSTECKALTEWVLKTGLESHAEKTG
jgi:hypothetical protein